MKKISLVSLLGLLAPFAASAHAADGDYYGYMPMMGWGVGSGMMWGGWVTTILVWTLLVVAIVALVKWMDKNK